MEFLKNIAPWFLPVFAGVYFLTEVYRGISLRGKGPTGPKKTDQANWPFGSPFLYPCLPVGFLLISKQATFTFYFHGYPISD